MQAVLLAAGKGSRIHPFSLNRPKPLLFVANKSLLEHNLDQLIGLVDEVILVVGYKYQKIQEHIGLKYGSLKIKYVVQEKPQGTGHAVLLTKPHIKNKFLVLNGDDLYHRSDIEKMIQEKYCILLKKLNDVSSFGVVKIKGSLVEDIVEKPKRNLVDNSGYVNTGLYIFTPAVFSLLEKIPKSSRGEYEITDVVKLLALGKVMKYHLVEGYWMPVGYPWQILDANKLLLSKRSSMIEGFLERGVQIQGNVSINRGSTIMRDSIISGNIIIGKNVIIGKGVTLSGHVSIGDNCVIGDHSTIENSVIGKQTQIGQACILHESVLGNNVTMGSGLLTQSYSEKGTIVVRGERSFDSKKKQLGAFVADNSTVSKTLMPGEVLL